MHKNKVVIKNRKEVLKWIETVNMIARSLLSNREALNGFNSISESNRIRIRDKCKKYDEVRRKKIPERDVNKDTWSISVMVDAHIIATEYGIDPLVVLMCVAPLCKDNEVIFYK